MNKMNLLKTMTLVVVMLLLASGAVWAADTDFDEVDDSIDNCVQTYNPDQLDSDQDGAGDVCDQDDDNDGIRDAGGSGGNPCPTTDVCAPESFCSLGANACTGAADCVVADQVDYCIAPLGECALSKQPCSATIPCVPVVDTCQRQCQASGAACTTDAECRVSGCDDNCPLTPNPMQNESDGDGIGDQCDNCSAVMNPTQSNIDGDQMGDACDADIDGDGQKQALYGMNCLVVPDANGDPGPSSVAFTCTGSGTPCFTTADCGTNEDCQCDDSCPSQYGDSQWDHDRDGVGSVCDNCVIVANSNQQDSDVDGLGNVCDNCAFEVNPDQTNEDNDNFGDSCDNCPSIGNNLQGDTDFDEIGDSCDNCEFDYNPSQGNLDSDRFGDACDPCPSGTDVDGDGVCSDVDNCPLTRNSDQQDLDFDGLGDACDCDRDGDGVADKIGYPDRSPGGAVCGTCSVGGGACDPGVATDCSGVCTPFGAGNCLIVACNVGRNTYPACGLDPQDLDPACDPFNFGIPSCCLDNCPDDSNPAQANSDADQLGNTCDPTPIAYQSPASLFDLIDLDGDSQYNSVDNCYQSPNYSQDDLDVDLLGDVCDVDADGDGVADSLDNCVLQFNPSQGNSDLDHRGDACDNCPFASNPGQGDMDRDGLGDRCDTGDEQLTLSVDPGQILIWDLEEGYTGWTLLRGDLALLRAGGAYVQGEGPLAGVDCLAAGTADVSGIAIAPGEAIFFLSGGFIDGAEDGFGNDSSGRQRISAAVCE